MTNIGRVHVYIRHFSMPPIDMIAAAVRSTLTDKLGASAVEIEREQTRRPGGFVQMQDYYTDALDRAAQVFGGFNDATESDFAVCISPIFVRGYNIVAIGARNGTGNEWLMSNFLLTKEVPVNLVAGLTYAVDTVLERRGWDASKITHAELERAASLTYTLSRAIETTADQFVTTGKRRLHS